MLQGQNLYLIVLGYSCIRKHIVVVTLCLIQIGHTQQVGILRKLHKRIFNGTVVFTQN